MADESQTPEEQPREAEETQAAGTAPEETQAAGATPQESAGSDQQGDTLAEHHAVPTADAAEIAGSTEDAELEAYEEAREESSAEQSAPVEGQAAEAEEVYEDEDEEEPAPRVKPAVPGAHLEVDIVPEGVDPLGRDVVEDPYAIEEEAPEAQAEAEEEDQALPEPISTAAIDLAAGARYRATGKRKTAIARVILRPGSGTYQVNGRPLDAYFPRATLQRNIRQPLETVGYEERMDVVARLHGGGVSAQAGALRHGISRALLEADPNLRGELKRRGFLTRDSRAKERKKAGLKKARKRPQFSKR